MGFKCRNCGLCCGPVPVTETELNKIKKAVERMPAKKRERLMKQKRDPFTCIFRDSENDNCSIYNVRPEVCRMFGFYEGMDCPNNPEFATRSNTEGFQRLEKAAKGSPIVGVLSVDINWNHFV